MVSHQSINYLLIFSFMLVNTAKSFLPLQARRSSFVSASSSPAFGLFSSIADEATEEQKQTKKTKLPMVILKRNRQSRSFRDGSQLVFSKSIDTVTDSVKVADLVLVNVPVSNDKENKNHQKIGVGVYNPNSMYRIRILSHSLMNAGLKFEGMEPSLALEMILTKSFQKALGIRRAMGFPSSYTDTYRLVNGEGDGISGLAVDVVGGEVAVIMSSAAWCQVHKATIMKCLQAVLPDHELVWKTTPSRLRQDGYILNADEEEADEVGDHLSPTIATENGIRYKTFPHVKGQKTSVYCDQRENRLNMAKLCEGKRVLDLCCYHGGFSLNAASHKATSVTGVDSSQDAIDISKENANLNDFDTRIEFVKADISSYMKACDEKYDVIVLDPPKLAPNMGTLMKASKKYHSLNRDALKLIDDNGGLLMTCTCSSAMAQKDGGRFFLQTVQQASLSAGRQVTLLRVSGAASCHTQSPVSFPAGNYLTAALFYVHPLN